MKIRLGDLRRLIRESLETVDLAAVKNVRGGEATITLYRPSALRSVMESTVDLPPSRGHRLRGLIDEGGVVGHLKVFGPVVECGGAWELSEIWGPGYGQLLANLAFAISNKIVIDRGVVLSPGLTLWKKVTAAMTSEPLPSGCETDHTEDVLNRVYSSSGDPAALDELTSRHAALMLGLSEEFNVAPKWMEEDLVNAAARQFRATTGG